MDIEFLHDTVDTVSAVMRTVETVDPICHSAVAENVLESVIVFENKLSNDFILFFCFRHSSLQSLVICCPCDPEMFAHPIDAPLFFMVEVLNRQIL